MTKEIQDIQKHHKNTRYYQMQLVYVKEKRTKQTLGKL
jgi:hypothetical protein